MRECKHSRKRYVRVTRNTGTHISVQCSACGRLLKLPIHHNRLFIKAFEIPDGVDVFDVTIESVTRHGN